MEIEKTSLESCFVLKPRIFEDNRGAFFESFNANIFKEVSGMQINFVQDNQSISAKGVLRGLHFQVGAYAQAKLVRVTKGEVLDVAVDLRKNSATFGKHVSLILNDKNNYQLFIPRGFAHGFVVLSNEAVFNYKCDNYYNKDAESGIKFNDPDLNIDWYLPTKEVQLSEKDSILPFFKEVF